MKFVKKSEFFNILDVFVLLFVTLSTIFLYRGFLNYGMEYDEVYRINNVFQHFNSEAYPYVQYISSLQIGSLTIPLMLKSYISYLVILPYLAVAWTGHPFLTLRILYLLYTILPILLAYFMIKKENRTIALLATGFLTFCPTLYPDIRFGWATILYIVPIVLFSCFLNRFLTKAKLRYLFLSIFCLFFYINIHFYFMWDIVAIIATLFILYPKKFLRLFKSLKQLLIIVAALLCSTTNYLIYNIQQRFPTLKTLWNYLFDLDQYNTSAIDGKTTSSLLDSISVKLTSYLKCIGNDISDVKVKLILAIVVAVILIHVVFAVSFLYTKTFQQNKHYFIPIIVSICTFILMLLSPNSQGSHHLTYISVPFCVSIAVALTLLIQDCHELKYVWTTISILFLALWAVQANSNVVYANETNGSGYFSEQIFSLIDYVDCNDTISDSNIHFIEWGTSSQFYFMHSGEFKITDYTWSIPSDDEGQENFFLWYFNTYLDQDTIYYIPIYTALSADSDVVLYDEVSSEFQLSISDAAEAYISYAEKYNWNCSIEETFYEENGTLVIILMKVEFSASGNY